MSKPRSRFCHLLSILVAASLAALIVPADAVVAQEQGPRGPGAAAEAHEFNTWFEVSERGEALEDILAPMLRSRTVGPESGAEGGFLPPIPYDSDQLTRRARNFGPGGTLKVWAQLFCQRRGSLGEQASLRGRIVVRVFVEDSATGWLTPLARFRAKADGGSVFNETKAKIPTLRNGSRLWFQLARDRVSTLKNDYCFFGYGIYRKFVGDGDS